MVEPLPGSRPGTCPFNEGWLFGGRYVPSSEGPGFDDGGFTQITLPHTVTPLSWGDWDHASWEGIWIYRKHFTFRQAGRSRVFADFDGVMADATVVLNGTTVATHRGGYLPFWSPASPELYQVRVMLTVPSQHQHGVTVATGFRRPFSRPTASISTASGLRFSG
jgi:beta-galactosidase